MLVSSAAPTLVANQRELLAFVERRVGNRAIAEDIFQEAFLRGVAKLDTIENDEAVVAWFYRVLRNAIIDHYRRHGAATRQLEAFAAELETQVEPDMETRGAVCQCIKHLAETLKPEYADAIRRIEVEGVSVKDYASEAGISRSNAGVRVFRAREALRKQVKRRCGSCANHGCLDCTCGIDPAH